MIRDDLSDKTLMNQLTAGVRTLYSKVLFSYAIIFLKLGEKHQEKHSEPSKIRGANINSSKKNGGGIPHGEEFQARSVS